MIADAPTRLDKLLAELKGLPDIHDRHSVIGRLRAIDTRITEAAGQVSQAILAMRGLRSIVGAGAGTMGDGDRKSLEDTAQSLLDLVESGKVTRASKRDDTLTAEITEAASRMLKNANAKWKSYFSERAQAYENLATAARNARLPGGQDLAQAVAALFRLAQTLPSRIEEVEGATATLETVRKAIESLGLEGAAGVFLVAAIRGDATLDMLKAEDVKQFLCAYPMLAQLLRVHLVV